MIEVLSRVPDSPVLWKHAAFVLDRDPAQSIEVRCGPVRGVLSFSRAVWHAKIFTSGVRDPPLSIDRVLDFLGQLPARNQLVEMYLEHVVRSELNTNEKYHTMLALQYLETVLTLLPTESSAYRAVGPVSAV
jgi:hypothetical protein